MTGLEPTVFVVDDDPAVRDSIHWLLASVSLNVEAFASGSQFLEVCAPDRTGCALVDVRMPAMSGLELQRHLKRQDIPLPVIILTGHGDVEMAVRAMKAGAFDFIQKPFNDQTLLETVQKAVDVSIERVRQRAQRACIRLRLDGLTSRERMVLDLIVAGQPNKVIARKIDRSEKTVEFHRARVMDKMQAKSLADLLRLVMLAELEPDEVSA